MGGLETIVKPSHWDDQGYWKEWVWRICSWSSPTGIQARTWGSCDIPVSCISAFSVWTVSWKTWDGTEFVRKQIWHAHRSCLQVFELSLVLIIPNMPWRKVGWTDWARSSSSGEPRKSWSGRVNFWVPPASPLNHFYGYIPNGYKLVIPNTLITLYYTGPIF